jgi:hypothetical protein
MGIHEHTKQIEAEADAVLRLKELLLASGIDDPELLEISIESETDFKEVVEYLLKLEGEIRARRTGLESYLADLTERKRRFKTQEDNVRTVIALSLAQVDVEKLETSFGTVSVKMLPKRLVIVEEGEVPVKYWIEPPKPDPVIDEKAVLADLVSRQNAIAAASAIADDEMRRNALDQVDREYPPVPGVLLSEPGKTIQIRRR